MICDLLDRSRDHPDVDQLWKRARKRDPKLSLASVYRTLKALERLDLVWRRDFGDGRARFEVKDADHHDHLIDIETGKVIEFQDQELEALKARVAERLGYSLEHHNLELYGRPVGAPVTKTAG